MTKSAQTPAITFCGLIVISYMTFYPFLREFGPIGLLFTLGFGGICCFLAQNINLFRPLIPFYIFSIIVLFLSLADAMPDGWTRYRDSFAAIRHWAWLPTLTLAGSAFVIFLRLHSHWIIRHSLFLAVAIFCLSRTLKYFLGMIDNTEEDFFIYGLTNENAPIVALVFIYIHCRANKLWKSLLVGLVLLLMSRSVTSSLVAVIGMIALWTKAHRLVLVSTIIGSALFLIGAQAYYREVHSFDPNTAVRGLFWKDSSALVVQTYGVGVGYGTEYVRNDFRGLVTTGSNRFIEEGAEDRLYLGTHSSVYDVAIRVGVIGLFLLLWGLVKELGGRPLSAPFERLRFAVIGSLIINNTFNMGLASINLTFGTALFLAIAIACRGTLYIPNRVLSIVIGQSNSTNRIHNRKN